MSTEAARGIDPRFDPRFQRGYTPDAAATATPPATATRTVAESAAVRAPHRQATSVRAEAAVGREARHPETSAAADQLADDHAATLLAYFGPKSGPEVAASRDEAQGRIGPPPTESAGHADTGTGAAHDDFFAVEPEPLSESPFVRHPSLRFWLALAVSIGFIVAGAALYWNVSLQQMSGLVALDTAGQALQNALSSLSMGLVQAGSLGVVVVLAVWGLQSARRRSS